MQPHLTTPPLPRLVKSAGICTRRLGTNYGNLHAGDGPIDTIPCHATFTCMAACVKPSSRHITVVHRGKRADISAVKSAKRKAAEASLAARYSPSSSPAVKGGVPPEVPVEVGAADLWTNGAVAWSSSVLWKTGGYDKSLPPEYILQASSQIGPCPANILPLQPISKRIKSKQTRGFATITLPASSEAIDHAHYKLPALDVSKPDASTSATPEDPSAMPSTSVLVKGCPPGCTCRLNQPSPENPWCSFDVSHHLPVMYEISHAFQSSILMSMRFILMSMNIFMY